MALSSLFNIKGLVYSALGGAVLSAAVAVPVTMWATAQPYKLKIADLELQLQKKETEKAKQQGADTAASLAQLQTFIGNMNKAGVDYSKSQGALFKQIDNLAKAFADEQKANPLPDGCKPTAERLRILERAVNAANAARLGSSP